MKTQSSFTQFTRDFLIEVGKGNIAGHKIINIPGFHEADVETAQLGDLSLMPGVVVLPTPGGIQLEAVSDSIQDDDDIAGSPGTGIRSIRVHYLDTSFNEQSEDVLLNGTTPVDTVATDIQTVQWIHTLAIGSGAGGVADGNISLRNTLGTITYEYIGAGGNQSLSARITIPNAKKGYLLNWHCSGLKKRIAFYLRATCMRSDRSLLANVFLFQDFEVCEASNSGLLDGLGLQFPAQCGVKISCKADGNGGEAGGGFSLLMVDD